MVQLFLLVGAAGFDLATPCLNGGESGALDNQRRKDMSALIVQDEKLISRPIQVVQSQFVDMQRHASTRVHADLEVSNVRPQKNGCKFTGRRRNLCDALPYAGA